ncbi:tetratricopeptide repeat protein [Flavonifractor plautii]|nr:tetratricopeptide repeat protein [Flavonifractor plautii]
MEPADAELYTTLGDVQERLGEVQEALQSYQKAIQIDPNYARAYNNRGLYTCPRWRQKRRWPITERRSNSREIGRFIM